MKYSLLILFILLGLGITGAGCNGLGTNTGVTTTIRTTTTGTSTITTTGDAKAQYIIRTKAEFEELKKNIGALEDRLEAVGGAIKISFDARLRALTQERDTTERMLDAMEDAAENEWTSTTIRMDQSLRILKDSYATLKSQIDIAI